MQAGLDILLTQLTNALSTHHLPTCVWRNLHWLVGP